MKQKKIFLIFLLCLLFLPFIAKAKDCDTTKTTITSIEQKSIKGGTEVIAEPVFEGRNISFNLKMYDIGDSISYNVTINNASDDDYMIDETTFKTDSDYVEYALETQDGNNVVKAKSSEEVVLSVTYKKEVDGSLLENGKYNAANELKLALSTDSKEKKWILSPQTI